MTTPHDLYIEATRRGLRLESAGDRLAVIPKGKCPPDFADVLREHKRELLDWLETKDTHLAPDCVPWLHIARQILAGEFDGADISTVRSLTIGLRSIAHPRCQQALARLRNQQPKSINTMNTDTNQIALVKRKPDWATIKTAYLNGDGGFRTLATQFGVSFHTIAKRAKREDWTGEMAKLCDAVTTTAMNTATERGKELGMTAGDFVERSIRETERWLNRIEALANDGKLTPDTLQKLVSSWRSTLAAGREAFGLNSEAPGLTLNLALLESPLLPTPCRPRPIGFDVTSEPK